MAEQRFSLDDYQEGLNCGLYTPPDNLSPYFETDPISLTQLAKSNEKNGSLANAIRGIKLRTGSEYFNKIYPLQGRTLGYSARTFPAYKYLLPDILTEDWLSIVDWRKYQRDHILHQPLCGYVLLKLLNGDNNSAPLLFPNGKTILETCVDNVLEWGGTAYIRDYLISCGMDKNDPLLDKTKPNTKNIWTLFLRETAYVAAVYHDLGYPWQYTRRLEKNLQGINSPAIINNYSIPQIVNLFEKRLLFRALNGYQNRRPSAPSTWDERQTDLVSRLMEETHGFPGALGFLHLNDFVRHFPSTDDLPFKLLCVEWAAMAIMMHDMAKIYWSKDASPLNLPDNPFLRLSLTKDPISTLVTLVDVIQDFERPSIAFGICRDNPDNVTMKNDGTCSHTELEIDHDGLLRIRYQMNDVNKRATKRIMLENENRMLFDAQYGYLDMSVLGINKVQMSAI